jgi:hypothetical protein
MKTHAFVTFTFLLLLCVPSHGQNSADSRPSMTGLRGVLVQVERLAPEVEDKGITSFVLAAEIESRLKDSGIPVLRAGSAGVAPGFPTLYVEVNAMFDKYSDRCTWSVRVDFMQYVRMERNPDTRAVMASTWSVGGVGFVMEDWRKAIVDNVLYYTDQFVAAFAAANPDGIAP